MFSIVPFALRREELLEDATRAVGPGAQEMGRDRALKTLFEGPPIMAQWKRI